VSIDDAHGQLARHKQATGAQEQSGKKKVRQTIRTKIIDSSQSTRRQQTPPLHDRIGMSLAD
jgi:hypothetical protein